MTAQPEGMSDSLLAEIESATWSLSKNLLSQLIIAAEWLMRCTVEIRRLREVVEQYENANKAGEMLRDRLRKRIAELEAENDDYANQLSLNRQIARKGNSDD